MSCNDKFIRLRIGLFFYSFAVTVIVLCCPLIAQPEEDGQVSAEKKNGNQTTQSERLKEEQGLVYLSEVFHHMSQWKSRLHGYTQDSNSETKGSAIELAKDGQLSLDGRNQTQINQAEDLKHEQSPPQQESQETTPGSKSKIEETQKTKRLKEITVIETKPVTAASSKEVREKDFELLPIIKEPSDLLRVVPGLVTVQHQAGGKADQFFLRGFDADHGTDIALFVDQLPINMRSHAHGQGYADLHFVIPETIQTVEVYKGPYFAEFGDFDTAGAVRLITKDSIPEGFVQGSAGLYAVDRFRSLQRYLTLFSPTHGDVETFGAFEILYDKGPFENPINALRINGFGKMTWNMTDNSQLKIWGSTYYGRWHASGQIPLRAVEEGIIDRFGSIDPSEGGRSQRHNVFIQYSLTPDEKSQFISSVYFTRYRLDLFSDFTFFLIDPINGDGIVQRDNRYLYGTDTRYNRAFMLFGREGLITGGIQIRVDNNHLILGKQTRRVQTATVNDVDIFELSFGPFIQLELNLTDWARTVLGLREDIYRFDVNSNDNPEIPIEGNKTDHITSYKANLILNPIKNTEFYFNFGTGFHSNDARVVVSNPSQATLPRAIGFEIGSRTRLLNGRLDLAAAFWYLFLKSELVFNGDEGTFSPSGSTRRYGGEFEARFSPFPWLFLHADLNLTHARFTNGDRIPLAPTVLSRSGLTFRTPFGLEGGVDIIYLAKRPAEETGNVRVDGFTRVDLGLKYRYKNYEVFTVVQNLLNTKDKEAQFFNESRLRDEPAPVGDIHFVPGNPFTFRVGFTYYLTGLFDGFRI